MRHFLVILKVGLPLNLPRFFQRHQVGPSCLRIFCIADSCKAMDDESLPRKRQKLHDTSEGTESSPQTRITLAKSRLATVFKELGIDSCDLEGFIIPIRLKFSVKDKKFFCPPENCERSYSGFNELRRHVGNFAPSEGGGRGHTELYGVMWPPKKCPHCNCKIKHGFLSHLKGTHPGDFKSRLRTLLPLFGLTISKYVSPTDRQSRLSTSQIHMPTSLQSCQQGENVRIRWIPHPAL